LIEWFRRDFSREKHCQFNEIISDINFALDINFAWCDNHRLRLNYASLLQVIRTLGYNYAKSDDE